MNRNPSIAFGNRLIAAMPEAARERILASLRVAQMPAGKILYNAGEQIRDVYFPAHGCIVSKLHIMRDGSSAEVALVGNEGMVGIAVFMGGGAMTTAAIVVSAGEALRADAEVMAAEFHRSVDLKILLLRYAQALMTQMAQTTVCNRHHTLVQRLCRLLLICLDHLQTTQLRITQESLSQLLGVRRESVTVAAHALQARHCIQYSRGVIEILDPAGLEKRACECYAVVADEYERLLAGPAAARMRPLPSSVPYRECRSALRAD
jgi:CRP-like cAMP-binding protein